MAFRVIDSRLAMLQITGFADDHAARIELQVPFLHFGDAVDGDAYMVMPQRQVRLFELVAMLDNADVEAAVSNRDIARRGATKFLEAKTASVKIGKLVRGFAVDRQIPDTRIHFLLPVY